MTELVSIVPAVEISTDTIVEIETALPNLQVNTSESITVEVQPDTYVLSSAGMYTGNMTGKIPTWILDAIQEQLTTGDGNLMSVLDDMKLLLGSLQLGVNQTISQIENTNTSMSALETSVVSRLNGNDAAILDVYATRVTPTEAQAIAVQAIGSTFNGNVDAYIGNLASAYTNATSAIATDIHTLQVSYNDQTARIDTVEEVSLSKNATIRSSTAPTLITNPLLISGDLWINTTNNVTKSWNGSSWVDITNTNAQQAYTWSATASKLITAPDGSVTGWSFGDGSNTKSNFKIKATNFSISDGTTGYTPFSIVGSDIQFNGTVSINKTQGSIFIGSYNSAPSTVSVVIGGVTYTLKDGDTYKNTTNNVVYYKSGASWLSTQGADGQGQVKGICFLRASSAPATPTGGSYSSPTATGWSDGIPAGTLPLYMTTRIFTSDGLTPQQSVWTTPQLTSALGQGTKVQFSVNGSTSWHDTPAVSDEYMRTGTSTDGGATWTYAGAVKIKGEAGIDGTNGVRGAISAFATYTTVTPTASELAATINIIANPDGCIVGDNVMYTVSGASGGTKMAYCTGAGNPGTWVTNVALYVNGDAVINGTMYANKIKAGHIGTAISTVMSQTNHITYKQAYASTITSAASFLGSLVYTNYANTAVRILISVSGRTGVTSGVSTNGDTMSFAIFDNGTSYAQYGWSPSGQDARSFSTTMTIAANSSRTISVYAAKNIESTNTYELSTNLMLTIIGIAEGV